ncbi:MAG: DUF4160 domain-containing protein [Azonexus sp.]|jgi:hypothetical protein|nr:DUF4160 domain-containing protein [Betaproteobacteria bacterium]MBP6035179.1 DUF4160 domain-containing protein [Azonexus sp.]MBP6905762.1 DUF4160 domain-containing protein [Azonexus sp.]
MPTVLRSGPFRFFFYAGDGNEPPHIHVARDKAVAKFWLDPVMLVTSEDFTRVDLSRLTKLVTEHRKTLLEAWNDYFHT